MLEWLGLPVQASAHAAELDHMTVLVHWLMLVLFIGWSLFFGLRVAVIAESLVEAVGTEAFAASLAAVRAVGVEVVAVVARSGDLEPQPEVAVHGQQLLVRARGQVVGRGTAGRGHRMTLLRELGRRKLRTTLTILGITIGIWALVVFSSMANQINGLVGMGTQFYADKITVTDGVAFGTSPMRLTDADTIAEVDGVAAVDSRVEIMWEADPAVGFSVPDTLNGGIPGADAGFESFQLELATGRTLLITTPGHTRRGLTQRVRLASLVFGNDRSRRNHQESEKHANHNY